MNNQKKKSSILIIILLFSFMFLCVSLGINIINNKKSKALGDTIAIGDLNRPVTDSKQEGRNLVDELKNLNSNYNEAVAWLKVPGTSIDTPIFQSKDNSKYLKTDRNGKKTKWGEPFMDYRCNANNIVDAGNYIIYGHNTEKDDNFTPLLNYKRKDFFDKHRTIELATLNGDYKFDIFSIYTTDINFYYIDTNFENSNAYMDFLNTVKNKSIYDTGITLNENDSILTLSTCDYSTKDGRFVIQAKLEK